MVPLTFDDVALYFSEEEWHCLEERQKILYRNVMMENFETLTSLGFSTTIPDIILRIERGEDPYVCDPQDANERGITWRHQRNQPRAGQNKTDFSKAGVVSQHVRVPSGHRLHPCIECGICFRDATYFLEQQETYGVDNSFTCTDGKRFTQKRSIMTRCKMHSEREPFRNGERTSAVSRSHSPPKDDLVHMDEKPGLRERFRLKREVHSLCKTIPFGDISECGKQFSNQPQFKTAWSSYLQKKTHAGEDFEQRFSQEMLPVADCEMLSRDQEESSSQENILENCSHALVKQSITYECSVCEKHFTQKKHLNRHQITHTKKKPFKCSECGKGFNVNYSLLRHQKIHAAEKARHRDRKYTCDECGLVFDKEKALKQHQGIHKRGKLFKYQCTECQADFITNSKLQEHQRTHTGERPYCCTECEKSFIRKSHLKVHERIHTGEKPYNCTECGICYRHKNALERHKTESHNGLA
uniref:Zinc finger protein 660-like isoform X2 n=1 Tax=Geotrypetes seraphini TaxID=260995 RepID=A0A6P8QME7_GEOSA|nr:zinc finger protein 660-like isoform X2 [Geotrypetes seraphini]